MPNVKVALTMTIQVQAAKAPGAFSLLVVGTTGREAA
jgi:hypothetical protein